MPRSSPASVVLTRAEARRVWLHAQGLDGTAAFGAGAEAVRAAIAHLGYVQIDTINVIERCHHHILWTRCPDYRREDLHAAQSRDKSVFEYWTHALSYVPVEDFRFYLPEMKRHRRAPNSWFEQVTSADLHKILTRIRDHGPLTIRDIDDDVLVDKDHAWASRKPSKRALQRAFYDGEVTISARSGMLKTYELTARHFGWEKLPQPATPAQVSTYLLDRALRSQGLVSLDSICYLDPRRKPVLRAVIEARVGRHRLMPATIEGSGTIEHWIDPASVAAMSLPPTAGVHLLSPFDPLVIQRRRLKLFFDYEHRFEAYVPKAKRLFGYFALPVLVGDTIVAVIDLKTDRANRALLVQQWTWVGQGEAASHRAGIEEALHRFEAFQLAARPEPTLA